MRSTFLYNQEMMQDPTFLPLSKFSLNTRVRLN